MKISHGRTFLSENMKKDFNLSVALSLATAMLEIAYDWLDRSSLPTDIPSSNLGAVRTGAVSTRENGYWVINARRHAL